MGIDAGRSILTEPACSLVPLGLGPRPRGVTWAGLALGAFSVGLLFRPEVSADRGVVTGLVAWRVPSLARLDRFETESPPG